MKTRTQRSPHKGEGGRESEKSERGGLLKDRDRHFMNYKRYKRDVKMQILLQQHSLKLRLLEGAMIIPLNKMSKKRVLLNEACSIWPNTILNQIK